MSQFTNPKYKTKISPEYKCNVFRRELMKIKKERMWRFTAGILKEVPDRFFILPASSSGKYHNIMDNQKGGLIFHTKSVVMALDTLLQIKTYRYMIEDSNESIDAMYAACILHDIGKYGFSQRVAKRTVFEHPILAGEFIKEYARKNKYNDEWVPQIVNNVERHHGQWNSSRYVAGVILPLPQTNSDILVHTADVMASRTYITFNEDKWK